MTNAGYMIDLGPKGGSAGGKLMVSGSPQALIQKAASLTVEYLAKHFKKFQITSQLGL